MKSVNHSVCIYLFVLTYFVPKMIVKIRKRPGRIHCKKRCDISVFNGTMAHGACLSRSLYVSLSICLVYAQELEVRSLNHPYSLKTKSSQCHYVVMTRSETKFQAPLNRRYWDVLAKTEHLTIKTMSTGRARHG